MADTTWKKWKNGEPLPDLCSNDSNLTYWKGGEPLPTFQKAAGEGIIISPEKLSITFSTFAPTVYLDYVVTISEVLSATLSQHEPEIRAGSTIPTFVEGTLGQLIYRPAPESRTEALLGQLIYRRRAESDVEAFGIYAGVKYEKRVDVEAFGIYVAYSTSFGVNVYISTTLHLTLATQTPRFLGCETVSISETLNLDLALHASTVLINAAISISETLNLDLALHEPTIQSGITISETLNLDLALHEPTVCLGGKFLLTKLGLTFSVKTASVCTDQVLSQATLHLNFSTLEASATTGFPAPLVGLTFGLYDPTILWGVSTLQSTLHLTFTKHAPAPHFDYVVEIGQTLSLQLSSHDVLIKVGVRLQEVLSIALSLYEPALELDYIVTVAKLSISLTQYPVSTKFDYVNIINETFGLTFAPYDITVLTGVKLYETLSVILSQYVPVVAYARVVSISSILRIIFNKIPPTVSAARNIAVPTSLKSLTLTSFDVEVTAGATLHETLPLNFEYPVLSVITNSYLDADLQNLNLSSLEPSVKGDSNYEAELLNLVWVLNEVEALTGVRLYETISLVFNLFDTTPSTDCNFYLDETLELTLSPHIPNVWGGPTSEESFLLDPLHKEREYGIVLEAGHGTYADREDSLLSSNFPLKYGTSNTLGTFCFWARAYDASTIVQSLFSKGNPLSLHGGISLVLINRTVVFYAQDTFHGLYNTFYPGLTLTEDRWYHFSLMIDNREMDPDQGSYCMEEGFVGPAFHFRIWDDALKQYVVDRLYTPNRDGFSLPFRLSTGPFMIGNADGDTTFLDGYIDDFSIFNAVRSPHETDLIRRGIYNGPTTAVMVEAHALKVCVDATHQIDISAHGTSIKYDPTPEILVNEAGLMVGYCIEQPAETPPFPVIAGACAQGDSTHLKYKFTSDVYVYESNDEEERRDVFTYPIREAVITVNTTADPAFLRVLETLSAGVTYFSVPLWHLKEDLTHDSARDDTAFYVGDSAEFYVGDDVLLLRASDSLVYDLCTNTVVAGSTVTVASPITRHYSKFTRPSSTRVYDPRSSWAVPCIKGIVTVDSMDFRGSRPTYQVKVKVDGGAWEHVDSYVGTFLYEPAQSDLIAPKMERLVIGAENGMLQLFPHLTTSRIAFDVNWEFSGTEWRDLRSLFYTAKGKTNSFVLPTWLWELRVVASASAGATSISLSPGFSQVWERFSRILLRSRNSGAPTIINLTAHQGYDVYTCDALPFNLTIGDKACLCPEVRFLEDEIEFEFDGKNLCRVKTSFMEITE